MQIKPLLTVSALALALGTAAPAIAATAQANAPVAAADAAAPAELTALVDQVDIPFEKFTLDNGLDVIDQFRPDQLFPDRAPPRARTRAVAGKRSHGLSARRGHAAEAR